MASIKDITQPFKTPEQDPANIVPSSRYNRLWRFSIIVTLLISLTPLIILTGVNYYQDQKALDTKQRYRISEIISNSKQTLEFIMAERISALRLIVSEHCYEELCSDEQMVKILNNLRESFGGYVDIGIIDSDGTQVNYAGPYDMEGRNYKSQTWFHEVSLRGVYVSDVFMGFRNFPHFVICLKHDKRDDSGFFIFRATLDMDLINQQIYSTELEEATDLFLVNHDAVLQTKSKYYGDVLDHASVPISTHSRNKITILQSQRDRATEKIGYSYIQGTPFIIVVSTKMQSHFQHWVQHQRDLLWFLFFMILIIVLVVIWRSTYMVSRLKASDEKHAKAYHNIEYTNKMATIGRMAASIAHEINNPLAIINEKAGLLKDMVTFTQDFPKKEKSLKLLDSVQSSVERCSKVTHRLLGFSRRMEVSKELIDLGYLLKEVVGFLEKEARHRNISINYHITDDLPAIESDRGQLQQIFLNLINNAIAAMGENGRLDIYIECKPDKKNLAVAIEDNGSGISKENLRHIFEPFYSTKGEFGTGLGLSITKDIVEKLGGKIEVESEINKGTCFTITLPIKAQGLMR